MNVDSRSTAVFVVVWGGGWCSQLTLGTIPGAGGTQRITRVTGKSMAMEMILANRWITADEALSCGLVSRVVPDDDLLSEAMDIAAKIAR